MQLKPPYLPHTPLLGGHPTTAVDVPICAVLLPFFVASAATNVFIYVTNKKAGHKFVLSMALFGFSMARIATLVMRIVWATRPTNARVVVAASVFTNAGVLILFVVNLVLTQRLVRARHPRFGWSVPGTMAFRLLFFLVIAMLLCVVPATVDSFFTLNRHTLLQIRSIQRMAGTFLAVLAALPVVIVVTALLVPSFQPLDSFGTGSWRTKVCMVLFTATLLTFGAMFRIAVAFATGIRTEWFHGKPVFYSVNFAVEITVVWTYVLMRFDRRFYVPDGSHGCYGGGDKTRGGER